MQETQTEEVQAPYAQRKGSQVRGRGRYKKHGKITEPISDAQFEDALENGYFAFPRHKAFLVFLYYTAARKGEALKMLQGDCKVTKEEVIIDIGSRLKKIKSYRVCPDCKDKNAKKAKYCKMCGKDLTKVDIVKIASLGLKTPPLPISRKAPYINELINAIINPTHDGRLFPYSEKTGYNIAERAGLFYPHLCRLSRITWFFTQGYTIEQIKSWTGLGLAALNFYVGIVSLRKMGRSLGNKKTTTK